MSTVARLTLAGAVTALAGATIAAVASPVSPAPARPKANAGAIVFSRSNQDARLFTVRADGSRLRRLSRTPWDADPAWSPNGRLVVFRTNGGRTGTPKIAVMRANGSGRRLPTRGPTIDLAPAWSPDGKRIVFARVQPRSGANRQEISLYVIRRDGTGLRRLTSGAEDWAPAWSPDGRRIAFARVLGSEYTGDPYCEVHYSAIEVMDADGTNVRRLSVGDRPEDGSPSWSPNGRRIVFVSTRDRNGTTSFEECSINGEVYVMSSDGSDVRRLTRSVADDDGPDWSPNGRRLIFSSGQPDADNRGPWLYVMPAGGGVPRRITSGPGLDTAPDWRAASVQP